MDVEFERDGKSKSTTIKLDAMKSDSTTLGSAGEDSKSAIEGLKLRTLNDSSKVSAYAANITSTTMSRVPSS